MQPHRQQSTPQRHSLSEQLPSFHFALFLFPFLFLLSESLHNPPHPSDFGLPSSLPSLLALSPLPPSHQHSSLESSTCSADGLILTCPLLVLMLEQVLEKKGARGTGKCRRGDSMSPDVHPTASCHPDEGLLQTPSQDHTPNCRAPPGRSPSRLARRLDLRKRWAGCFVLRSVGLWEGEHLGSHCFARTQKGPVVSVRSFGNFVGHLSVWRVGSVLRTF
mmetsp:Transcript_47179/g.93073  ORF Transcript_47179/g.93073 Transcript_47179/m.93073 type:complete len:219 (-) Transcript_47179:634-1290(-)